MSDSRNDEDQAQLDSSEPKSDLPSGIGRPATRALHEAGIIRLEQLTKVTEKEVLKLHGVGPKAMNVLRLALADRGSSFAETPSK